MGITVRYHKHLFLRLSVLFVCLIIGVTLFSQNVYAIPDDGNRGTQSTDSSIPKPNTSQSSGGSNFGGGGGADSGNVGDPTGAYSASTEKDNFKEPSGDTKVESMIYNAAVGLGGFITYIGGAIFDLAIDKVVLKMGCWFVKDPIGSCAGVGGTGSIGAVVNELWIVIRDLFNILFIFSLIFIGLKTIWSPSDSSTKKALGLLIAAALLINFSLYVTKVIVDMSNYAAVAIHSQATSGIRGDSYGLRTSNGEDTTIIAASTKQSLSGAYMQTLGLSSWFATDFSVLSIGKIIVFSLMFLLSSIILGITLFWGGIMLITRFVALIIFMIFSPAMFLGWVLPQFQKYTSQWWSKFLSCAFFAPAYIFMLYLGLYALIQLEAGFVKNGSYAEAVLNGGGATSIFLFYAIAITFLVAATKVGQSMSTAGAGTAMTTMKGVRNKTLGVVGGATFGMGARIGRNTVGNAAQRLSESEKLKNTAASSGISGTMARGLLKSSRVVGDSSFEVRRVGGIGKKLGVGEGSKGGYKTKRDAIVKKEQEFAKSLGEIKDDDEKVHMLTIEKQDFESQLEERKIAKEGATGEEKKKIAKEIATLQKSIKMQDQKIKAEKKRRQIGSEGDITQVQDAIEEQKIYKKKIKELQNGFAKLSVSEKKQKLKEIKAQEKLLKELQKKVRVETGSQGYAGILENRNIIGSALYARVKSQDNKAGKEIRKTFEKAIKKSKDDMHFDSLKDAVSKKDT